MMMRTERLAHERRNMLQSKLLSLIGVRQRFAEKAGAAAKKERGRGKLVMRMVRHGEMFSVRFLLVCGKGLDGTQQGFLGNSAVQDGLV